MNATKSTLSRLTTRVSPIFLSFRQSVRSLAGRSGTNPPEAIPSDESHKSQATPALYRQGDVLLRQIASIPRQAQKRNNGVLVEGEVSGHAHRVEDATRAEVWEVGDGLYLRVGKNGVRIVHEEHVPITLPAGDYEVIRQREYTPPPRKVVTQEVSPNLSRTRYVRD
ncbi:MAG TPA: hypothetical protein VFA89_02690 [Terriglobales bacterium]|nr:hypothetical protein [Terriglobales bacterium]